ncbi:DUF982 domain-containing protein [Rhizobium tumorigenes]|uniref:DUF982 domain-containing protein n=1 Tax=Rhizobium tumorigenes TaxID=2041385 RepID=A0AAF1KCM5_9HYPH|nr:DUF982 domain-containing protein [Rhizobium tumorigenes]WFR97501.1 DUF982 domain-containing protein [Rhizobium tumorigenes]
MPSDLHILPVQIAWGGFRTLASVTDIAECLVREWPGPTDGNAYVTALMICDAVLSGGEDDTPEHARESVDLRRKFLLKMNPIYGL